MVRKVISFTLIFMVLFVGYQLGVNYLKKEHSITYTVNNFKINEDYSSNNGDYYLIYVEDGDKSFIFETENNYNKQKEIVKDVKTYKNDDVYCLSVEYKTTNETSIPLCYIGDVLYSYNEAKTKVNLSSFIKKLKIRKTELYPDESEKRQESDVIINNDYVQENEVIIVYDYKKMQFFDKKFARYAQFSNIDNYKNTYGALVSHYYMIPRIITSPTYNTFVRYEVIDGISKDIKLPYSISKQSYVNGVYKNKLYIFDKSNLKQYEINPVSEEVKITGDTQTPCFAYINGEVTTKSVYEMNEKEIKFSEKNYGMDDIIDSDYMVSNKKIAIYTKSGNFYKLYKKYPKTRILLFTEKNAKEVKIKEDNIYYLKGDTIYRYNNHGNVPLITRTELKYNYENSFDIYLK